MRLYHGSKSGTIAAAIVPVFPAGARVAFYGDSITKNGGAILRVAAQYRADFPGTNPYIVRVVREYLQYKPQEAEMRARLQ